MKRVRVKPGKAQSAMGFVVGLLFCGVGVFIIATNMFGFFGIIWACVAVAITVTNGINAFGKKGVTSYEVLVDDDRQETAYTSEALYTPNDSSEIGKRLTQLKELRNAGIITNSEYDEQRAKILSEI